jgi:S1-C subfamily serine protease
MTCRCGLLALVVVLLTPLQAVGLRQVATSQPASLRVLRIVAGPAGTESGGTFVLTEERSVFSVTSDREVIVHFEWEGTPGQHKLVAQWRSPDGGLTSTSAIDYAAADRRFGAYWRLGLVPTMPLGNWSIETTVDGQPAGRFTFELRSEAVAAVIRKRPLAQAELFERLNRMFLVIERSTSAGRRLEPAAGFVLGTEHVYSALSVLDAADTVNALAPDGSRHPLTSIVGFDRGQDWAVLAAKLAAQKDTPVALADEVRVGDRCFSMEGSSVGGRVLVEGSVTGQAGADATRRLLVSFLNGTGTPGAPLLNEYGELIGIIGSAGVTGATGLLHVSRFRSELRGAPVAPFSVVRVEPDAPAQSTADLRQRGTLVLPLVADHHVLSGGFARDIATGQTVAPTDQRQEFSSREREFVAFVTWAPSERLRGATGFRMHDADNRVIMEGKPAKIDVRKGQLRLTYWKLPVPTTPGLYRLDVLFADQPIWREFVRITP